MVGTSSRRLPRVQAMYLAASRLDPPPTPITPSAEGNCRSKELNDASSVPVTNPTCRTVPPSASPTSAHGSVIVTTTHDGKRSAAPNAAPRLKVTRGMPGTGLSQAAQRGNHGVPEHLSSPRREGCGLDLKPPFLEA